LFAAISFSVWYRKDHLSLDVEGGEEWDNLQILRSESVLSFMSLQRMTFKKQIQLKINSELINKIMIIIDSIKTLDWWFKVLGIYHQAFDKPSGSRVIKVSAIKSGTEKSHYRKHNQVHHRKETWEFKDAKEKERKTQKREKKGWYCALDLHKLEIWGMDWARPNLRCYHGAASKFQEMVQEKVR
jgi:hypothetical protein